MATPSDDEKMSVRKGFSDFLFCFLAPNLPPPRERESLVCHWPRWQEDHWRASFGVQELPEYPYQTDVQEHPVLSLRLYADGRLDLFLDDLGLDRVRLSARLELEEDPRDVFHAITNKFGSEIVEHLTQRTRKPFAS